MAWSLVLALLALFTSNPPAISRDQILRSDAIVIASPIMEARSRIRIERVISGDTGDDEVLTVLNWGEIAAFPAGPPYLVPLSRFRQHWRVTVLDRQQSAPLIYDARPETIGEVKQALAAGNR